MAQNDLLKRYLDAGVAFTQMTRQRAEAIVRDLVKAGEMQSDQAQQAVQELVDRSRENTERLVEMMRNEMRDQISSLGLATRDDLARLEKRIDAVSRPSATKAATKTAAPAAKATKAVSRNNSST